MSTVAPPAGPRGTQPAGGGFCARMTSRGRIRRGHRRKPVYQEFRQASTHDVGHCRRDSGSPRARLPRHDGVEGPERAVPNRRRPRHFGARRRARCPRVGRRARRAPAPAPCIRQLTTSDRVEPAERSGGETPTIPSRAGSRGRSRGSSRDRRAQRRCSPAQVIMMPRGCAVCLAPPKRMSSARQRTALRR